MEHISLTKWEPFATACNMIRKSFIIQWAQWNESTRATATQHRIIIIIIIKLQCSICWLTFYMAINAYAYAFWEKGKLISWIFTFQILKQLFLLYFHSPPLWCQLSREWNFKLCARVSNLSHWRTLIHCGVAATRELKWEQSAESCNMLHCPNAIHILS